MRGLDINHIALVLEYFVHIRYFLVLIALVLTNTAFAQSVVSFPTTTSLTYGVVFAAPFNESSPAQNHILSLISPAIALVSAHPIRGVKLAEGVITYDVIIAVTTSYENNSIRNSAKEQGYIMPDNQDAYTTVINNQIVITLLFDKIMYNSTPDGLVEAPNAFSRLIVALAHEIYGNALSFHKQIHRKSEARSGVKTSANVKNTQLETQVGNEINTFSAGIEFIKKILHESGSKLTPKIVKDLTTLLTEEELSLQSWIALKSRPTQVHKISQSCSSILKE